MSTLGDVMIDRVWWTADVRRSDDSLVLWLRPGARHVVVWRNTLEPFTDSVEPEERADAAVRDRFIACGPSIDETLMVEALRVDGAEWRVRVLEGDLAETTDLVQLTAVAAELRRSKRRRSAV
jgi:hypothetical protein